MSSYSNGARKRDVNSLLIAAFHNDERALREQRAHDLGPSDARHLRLVANDIEDEGIIELPGVDAARLRLLADKLEDGECEIESLRQHANALHRALADAIVDLDDDDEEPVVFVFIHESAPFAPESLTPEQFSDLAVFLLDEIE